MAGAMVISSVQNSDIGSYRCVSRNSAGEISTTLHLISSASSSRAVGEDDIRLKLEPEIKVANLGSSAMLHCWVYNRLASVMPGMTSFKP
jgi:uncharacterized protein YodC (DUF2158 family)